VNTITFLVLVAITLQVQVGEVVEQMRGLSMQLQGIGPSNGILSSAEQRKRDIIKELFQLGKESIPPLTRALKDPDIQMRRNAALVLTDLGGGYFTELRPSLDTQEALPDLIEALEDPDRDVRAWAAQAIAEIGPNAKDAIPFLITLLRDAEEGPRNSSCIALGRIGPAAKEALPDLREALKDPSKDVRQFAQRAIEKIQKE